MENFFRLFNVKNGYWNLFSLLVLPFPRFTRFYDHHVGIALKKSAIQSVLVANPEITVSFSNRFRSIGDYTIWIVRYYLMLTGQFVPRSIKFGKRFSLNQDQGIKDAVEKKRHKMICINDVEFDSKENYFKSVDNALNVLTEDMPIKSSFER